MDPYEEFGLPRAATPDQIRQTHKALARLLHPDQFQDAQLKRLAEGQMKRVNEIFAQLSASGVRKPEVEPEPDRSPPARYRQHAGWFAAAGLALAWILTALVEPVAPAVKPPAGVRPRPVETARPAPPPVAARPAPRERRSPAPAPSAVRAEVPELPSQARIDAPPPLAPSTVVPGVVPVESEPPPPKPKGLAGRWLYLHPPVPPPSQDLYPPEYIEAAIVEEAGTLRGRYRARYRVADRAIWPEVDFQFEGAFSGDVASLPWTGGGGLRGEVRLRQISPDTLEVKWLATDLGKTPGLASGTAVLVRRQDP